MALKHLFLRFGVPHDHQERNPVMFMGTSSLLTSWKLTAVHPRVLFHLRRDPDADAPDRGVTLPFSSQGSAGITNPLTAAAQIGSGLSIDNGTGTCRFWRPVPVPFSQPVLRSLHLLTCGE